MGEPLDLSPPFLGTKSQLKHHGQDRLFAEASSGLIGPMSNRGKARFNRVGRPDKVDGFVKTVFMPFLRTYFSEKMTVILTALFFLFRLNQSYFSSF